MLSIGRQGQLYVGLDGGTYGATPTVLAADAIRHVNVTMPFDNKNRVTVMEKKQSPGAMVASRADRRKTATFTLEALLRPSGVINTAPEADDILVSTFGSKRSVVLATTFNAGATVTGGTLASGTGLAVNDGLLITCPDGKKRLRRLTAINPGTGVGTWAPALPTGQQPATGAAAKGVITYAITSALTSSFWLAHYLKKTDGTTAALKRLARGCAADRWTLAFDANEEVKFTLNGFAKDVIDAPAHPGGFTTVGALPPSGMVGEFYLGDVLAKFVKLSLDINNGMYGRNDEADTDSISEIFRSKRQEINTSLDMHAEDETTLYDLAEAGTNTPLFRQNGFTEGNIVGIAMPQVEWKVPNTDDPDEVVNWPYTGMALESADGLNDEVFLYLA